MLASDRYVAWTVFIDCVRTKETKISQLSYPRPMRLRTVMTIRTATTSVLKTTTGVRIPISSGPLLIRHSDSGISEDVDIAMREDSQDPVVHACFEWFRESRERPLRTVGGGSRPYIYCTLGCTLTFDIWTLPLAPKPGPVGTISTNSAWETLS